MLTKIKDLCELYEAERSQYIELFLGFLRDAEAEYTLSKDGEAEQDALTQDILHCLELKSMGYHDRARLAAMLSESRKVRRKYKDAMEELTPVIQFIDQNKKIISTMEQLLGAVRKQEKYHENRSYHPKVLNGRYGGAVGEKD